MQAVLRLDEGGAHRDTYLVSNTLANNNFGDSPFLLLGVQNVSKGVISLYRMLLRWNVSQFYGSVIDSAALRIELSDFLMTSGDTFRVYRLTQPNWTELGATWNQFDGATAWTSAGGDFDPTPFDSLTITSAGGGLTGEAIVFPNMKPAIDDALINRNGILDLLIKGDSVSPTRFLGAFSSNNDESFRPTLTVNYHALPRYYYD
jgi:hypothetical protein